MSRHLKFPDRTKKHLLIRVENLKQTVVFPSSAARFIPCFIYPKQTANVKCFTSCKPEGRAREKTDHRQGVLNADRKSFYELDIDQIIIVS